jgi:RNA polymerase sigma factor (sigma-70 family)
MVQRLVCPLFKPASQQAQGSVEVEIEQLRANDRTAWNRAFEVLYAISLSVCCSTASTMNHHEQEDVAVEAVEEVIGYVEKVNSFEECKKLVVTISKNRLMDRFRSKATVKHGAGQVESLEQQEGFEAVDINQQQPDALALAGENLMILKRALLGVPEQYREVVEDFYLKGLTQQETADKLGLKIGSIGVYLDRGLKALKSNLPAGWP